MAIIGGSYSQSKNALYPRESYADRVKQNTVKQSDTKTRTRTHPQPKQHKQPLLATPKTQKTHNSPTASASSETVDHKRRKIAPRNRLEVKDKINQINQTKSKDIPLSNRYNLLSTPDNTMVVDETSPSPSETTPLELSQSGPEMNHDRSSSQVPPLSHSGPPPPPSTPLVKASNTALPDDPERMVDGASRSSGRPPSKPPAPGNQQWVNKMKSTVTKVKKDK